jgi:hypothetical protein
MSIKIDSLDVMKAEQDLQDRTRMQDVYKDITVIIDQISKLPVFPSLVWVWTWDVCLSTLENFRDDEDYVVSMTNEEVWELFWRDADKNGFSLEYGTETLNDHISDWLLDVDVVKENDGDEDEDE